MWRLSWWNLARVGKGWLARAAMVNLGHAARAAVRVTAWAGDAHRFAHAAEARRALECRPRRDFSRPLDEVFARRPGPDEIQL